jgi:hypothetical protein
MDHTGMEIDRVDLERYRKGLPPLKRKWVKAGPPVSVDVVIKESLRLLREKQSKKVK